MRKILLWVFTILIALTISCGGGSNAGGPKEGGPDTNLDNLKDLAGDESPVSAADVEDLIAAGLDKDNADAEVSDDPEGEPDTEKDDPEEPVVDPKDEVVDEALGAIDTIDLTLPAEGWSSVGEELEIVSSEAYANALRQIEEYRGVIKGLRKDIKALKKSNASSAEIAAVKAEIKAYRKRIRKLRKTIGFARTTGGIVSGEAGKPIELTIPGIKEAGWYEIAVTAKNYKGELPSWYDYFMLNVSTATDDEAYGGLLIKASKKRYKRGTIRVYLTPGSPKINLTWINSAHKKDKYDTYLNIRSIGVRKVSTGPKVKKLKRNAKQYALIDGTYYAMKQGMATFWANQTIGYKFTGLKPGRYRVVVTAKNYGTLPPNYTHFNVAVDTDAAQAELKIPAAQKKFKKGKTEIDLFDKDTTIYLTWKNDKYKKGVYDANILIRNVRIKRIGDTKGSALTAFLVSKGKSPGYIFGAFLVVLGLLTMVLVVGRRLRSHA